jgi:hypothetical protein
MGFIINKMGNKSPGLYGPGVEHFKLKNPLKGKLKGAVNKITTAKNKAIQEVKNKPVVKRVVGNVKQKLANLASSKGFIVLAPYKQVMRAILKKRGHPISNSASIQQVATLFYDAVIKGKTNFNYSHYQSGLKHLSENATNLAVSGVGVGVTAATGGVIPPGVTAGIIKAILEWFKKIKDKKDQGATLAPEEKIANDADEVIEAKGEIVTTTEKSWLQRFLDSIFGGPKKESFRRRIDSRNKASVNQANKPSNIVKAPTVTYTRPLVSATEIAYSNVLKPNVMQNLAGRGTVRSANDIVGNPTQSKLTPNSWFQDKGGKWHWVNNRGKIVA